MTLGQRKKAFRSITIILLIMALALLIVGCERKPTVPPEIDRCLAGISQSFQRSVDGMDLYDALKPFLNEEKPELRTEMARRLRDIKQSGVKEIRFKVIEIEKKSEGLPEGILRVRISESYKEGNRQRILNYWADFLIKNGSAYYSDLAFRVISEGRITLYYSESLNPIAKKIFESVKLAYSKVGETFPGRTEKFVIKVYDDDEIFSSFIKPSIGFPMLGWSEQGESVKINLGRVNWQATGDPVLKKILGSTLTHEITHLISGEMSGNNMPYWFAEGLATYMEDAPLEGKPSVTLDDLATENIENVTDQGLIRQYYMDSALYIHGLVQKKGKEEIIRLLEEMGQYPKNSEDAANSMDKCNKVFEELCQKEYGLSTRKFGEFLLK